MTFVIGLIIAVIAGGLGYFGGFNTGHAAGLENGKLAGKGATVKATPSKPVKTLKVARAKTATSKSKKTRAKRSR